MDQETNPNVLHWRDLSAEDVYHIAHLENEARDLFAAQIGKITFSGRLTNVDEFKAAQEIVTNNELHAQSWLGTRALVRGLEREALETSGEHTLQYIEGKITPGWFKEQLLTTDDTNVSKLAKELGVAGTTLYNFKSGRAPISISLSARIANAIADAKNLEGEERDAFIKSATSRAGDITE